MDTWKVEKNERLRHATEPNDNDDEHGAEFFFRNLDRVDFVKKTIEIGPILHIIF